MQKLPHTISTEELLKSLKEGNGKSVEEVSVISSDPILSFLQTFKLEPGQYYISVPLLFSLFRQWSPKIKIDKRNFSLQVNKYLPYEGQSLNKYFKLNISPIKLGEKVEGFTDKRGHSPTKSKNYKARFERFLKAYKLKEGDLYVEADIMFYLYDTWLFKHPSRLNKLAQKTFTDLCSLYFDSKHLCNSTLVWFGVSKNIEKHLKKEEVENWRAGRIKYGKEKHKHSKTNYIPKIGNEDKVIYKETIYRDKQVRKRRKVTFD